MWIIKVIFLFCVDLGKRWYTHHFLLQLRFTPAACVRPVDLELIPGVTDITPGKVKETQHLYSILSLRCSTVSFY